MPEEGVGAGAADVASKSKNVLTKKFGPLPVWGWAGVIAGGYLIFRWYKGKQAGATPTSQASLTSNPSALGYTTGGNTGGADNASVDSFLGQLQGQLNALQQQQQAPTQAQTNPIIAFLSQYSNPGGPITLDQAEVAVINAYQTFLGRNPENSQVVQNWANQIVQQQNYVGPLSQIIYSPEGEQHLKNIGQFNLGPTGTGGTSTGTPAGPPGGWILHPGIPTLTAPVQGSITQVT